MVLSSTAIRCQRLGNPTNGRVLLTDTSVGSVATYTCFPGFRLVGNQRRTCQTNGQWTGSTPTCSGKAMLTVMIAYTSKHLFVSNNAFLSPIDTKHVHFQKAISFSILCSHYLSTPECSSKRKCETAKSSSHWLCGCVQLQQGIYT